MNTKQSGFGYWALLVSLLITLSIGGVASFFTIPQISTWYVYLNKPAFNPPNWLFGPVWTLLYIMMAIAAFLVWQKRDGNINYIKARNIYLRQLLFNFSWSIVFFGMHQILGALLIIALLLISIVFNIVYFGKISKVAAWLLVPYLLWVSFASILNFAIYILNK
ncbi:TspO/MBR related protein [Mucilaginibacter gracilis]|uniref:TspO/MBR related protein n=1 Tax=Mucilaginibacter gracilis TaxID=423350 RepID=A0A495J194_9SPHI|nr:TspO/MBR family protein [Mucilaginibacter gracilis]RKR82765.1 TspO/MBR related protein [Mucilaginibacter gracilis]